MMDREEGRPSSVGRAGCKRGALMTTLTAVAQKRSTLRRLGWLARRVVQKIFDDNVFGLAGQLAFFFLLAVFPFLLVVATLLPYVTHPDALNRLILVLQPVVPPRAMSLVQGNLHTLLTYKREGLLSLSAVALLWSASAGFAAVIEGINIAYGMPESRPFWKARLMAVGLTLVLGLMALVSTVLLVFGERLSALAARYLGLPLYFWTPVRWVAGIGFLILVLDITYYAAPSVRHRWRWLTPGAVLAVSAWVMISLGLSFYLPRYGRYEATYGALTAVISLMLWFYASAVVLLVGGELNSALERDEQSTGVVQNSGEPPAS